VIIIYLYPYWNTL